VFLPKSPVLRFFELTFGRIKPKALGFTAAYVSTLIVVTFVGFALRFYTQANSAVFFVHDDNTVVISAWPQPADWMKGVYSAALSDEDTAERVVKARGENPVVATILPPRYRMKAMYYKKSLAHGRKRTTMEGFSFTRIGRIALYFLLPIKGIGPKDIMGVDPDSTDEPVQVVFSLSVKPYKERIGIEEA
ncbi:MAG: hypothetical protein GY771_01745, partial [bacterium]|nr:hypothetical protein [bacterium]